MGITCFPLIKNNVNLSLPVFGCNYPILPWIIFINDCICILTGLPGIFFVIAYVIQKIGGNKNSPNSLNIMANYHYHSEDRVITQ